MASLRAQLAHANARSKALAEALTGVVSRQSLGSPQRRQLLVDPTQGPGEAQDGGSGSGTSLLHRTAAGSASPGSHRATPRGPRPSSSSLRQPSQLDLRAGALAGWETPPAQSPRPRPPPPSRAEATPREASSDAPSSLTVASPPTQPPDSVVVLATRVAELELRAQRAEASCSELRRALAAARAAAAGTADDGSVTSASSSGTSPPRSEPTTGLPAAVPAQVQRPAAKLLARQHTAAAASATESVLTGLPRAELAAEITRLRQRLNAVSSQRFNGCVRRTCPCPNAVPTLPPLWRPGHRVMHSNAIMIAIAGAVCLKFRGHGRHRADRRWLCISLERGLLGWSKRLRASSSFSSSSAPTSPLRPLQRQRSDCQHRLTLPPRPFRAQYRLLPSIASFTGNGRPPCYAGQEQGCCPAAAFLCARQSAPTTLPQRQARTCVLPPRSTPRGHALTVRCGVPHAGCALGPRHPISFALRSRRLHPCGHGVQPPMAAHATANTAPRAAAGRVAHSGASSPSPRGGGRGGWGQRCG